MEGRRSLWNWFRLAGRYFTVIKCTRYEVLERMMGEELPRMAGIIATFASVLCVLLAVLRLAGAV
jgi:hypothetical protein